VDLVLIYISCSWLRPFVSQLLQFHYPIGMSDFLYGKSKEDIKEQPTSRNLSATATRVLQCTCPVAASCKDFSAIPTSPLL
jgi:hypothetical protein